VEQKCAAYYAESNGRPSIPPSRYFRILLIGYFEGIESERGLEWRCQDSLSLRDFLGLNLSDRVPDHSSLSRIRQRLPLDVHHAVFSWVLGVLQQAKLLQGKRLGIDATTLEANAAMRSIVRKDTGEGYEAFLTGLAKASGIETPTREDLARLDRKREGKASNDDWEHPDDPDSGITKMKDGRTHLAHKAEHAVDLDSGAIVAVTVQNPVVGDTQSGPATLESAVAELDALNAGPAQGAQTLVMDKGYHSNQVLAECDALAVRAYVSEPRRGRRRWQGKADDRRRVYANRRRIAGTHGKRLLRDRAEKVERSFQHCYDRGGLRRLWVRGCENVTKRVLCCVAAFNLGILMRKLTGAGTPKALQGLQNALVWLFRLPSFRLRPLQLAPGDMDGLFFNPHTRETHPADSNLGFGWSGGFSTGC
jgi:transposase